VHADDGTDSNRFTTMTARIDPRGALDVQWNEVDQWLRPVPRWARGRVIDMVEAFK
jgi:hypothetical protein